MFEMQKKQTLAVKSTQSALRVNEIISDCLVMTDGTLRAVLSVSSTNFDLKNQDEQDALIFSYQRFLNSLDFPIQILMQSRRVEVGQYLEKLKGLMNKQSNELLRVQTAEYINFISQLIENANITNKNFYVIIPLSQSITPAPPGMLTKFFGNAGREQATEKLSNFQSIRKLLDERVSSVQSNLSSVGGIKVSRLNTQSLIELLYNSYNFESGPVLNASQLGEVKIFK